MSTKSATKTLTRSTTKPNSRYQITFPKNSSITKRIISLSHKYDGMDLPEIVKLALIKLDDSSSLQANARYPDAAELAAIENFITNPQTLTAEESNKFLQELRVIANV